jgi:hypothetical protein
MAPKKTPAAGPAAAAAAIPDTSLPERLRSGGSRPPSTAASKAASKGSKAASGASGTDIAAARRPAVDPWHEGTTYEHHCPACDARRGAIRHYNLIPITHPQTVIDAESELGKMLAEAYPGVDLSTYVCQGDTPSLKKVKLLKHEGLWEAMYYTMRVYTQWEIVECFFLPVSELHPDHHVRATSLVTVQHNVVAWSLILTLRREQFQELLQ